MHCDNGRIKRSNQEVNPTTAWHRLEGFSSFHPYDRTTPQELDTPLQKQLAANSKKRLTDLVMGRYIDVLEKSFPYRYIDIVSSALIYGIENLDTYTANVYVQISPLKSFKSVF